MKIILKKDFQGLGYKDEILTVKDGYGRNYLLPQRLAVLATDKAVKELNEELKQRAHKLAKIKAEAEDQAKKFEGISLSIAAKVAEEQNIYGSVGPAQIVEALAKKGIELDAKKIITKGVKVLGQHVATIQLHKEVVIEVPFEVVSEDNSKKTDKKKDATEEAPTETVE